MHVCDILVTTVPAFPAHSPYLDLYTVLRRERCLIVHAQISTIRNPGKGHAVKGLEFRVLGSRFMLPTEGVLYPTPKRCCNLVAPQVGTLQN